MVKVTTRKQAARIIFSTVTHPKFQMNYDSMQAIMDSLDLLEPGCVAEIKREREKIAKEIEKKGAPKDGSNAKARTRKRGKK